MGIIFQIKKKKKKSSCWDSLGFFVFFVHEVVFSNSFFTHKKRGSIRVLGKLMSFFFHSFWLVAT